MSDVLVTIRGESGATEQFRIGYSPTLQLAYNTADTTARDGAQEAVPDLAVARLQPARGEYRLAPRA